MLRKWHLHKLLYSLVLAIILPTGCLLFYNIYNQYKQAEDAASVQAYNLAQIAANNTHLFIRDGQAIIQKIAQKVQPQSLSSAKNNPCDPVFSEFQTLNTRFANLSQASKDGYLICSALPQPNKKITFVGDTYWFKEVSHTKAFVIAPPYQGPVSGKMVSVLAYPLLDQDGQFAGSVQMPIDLVNLRLLPGMDNLPDYISVSIVDADGYIVARSREAEKFVGKNLRGVQAMEMLLRIRDGTTKATSSEGVERIYGFVPIDGTDWYVSVGISTQEVLKAPRDLAIRNLAIGMAMLLAVFMLAIYIGRAISKPIRNLQSTAYLVSSGNLNERADLQGPSEIEEVASQFNSMLDVIDKNNQERDLKEREIYNLAFYDALTELPNRRLLINHLEEVVLQAQHNHFIGAIAYINVDRFKDINDLHGHFLGDQFLKQVAQRFMQCAKQTDFFSRLDADKFVLIRSPLCFDEESKLPMANALCKELHAIFEKPFVVNDVTLGSSCSVGLTFFPKAINTSDSLLREADVAIYKAKDQGRNQNVIYDDLMLAQINERILIELELKKAIETNQIQMHVQPQLNAAGQVIGAELLLRWFHPELGKLSPDKFIPIAERSGLIFELGQWTLNYACSLVNRLEEMGSSIPVSINVSPKQFRHPAFLEQAIQILERSGANPRQLIFEVTEGLFIEDVEEMAGKMQQLHNLGIRFSIDDFGTGYSNLAYLKQLPLYELKIDKRFVDDIPYDLNDKAIVQTILSMAKSLNLKVVAEDVETEQQSAFLLEHRCDALQGYLYSKPIEVENWLSGIAPRHPLH